MVLVEKFKGALVVGFLRLFALLPWRAVQAVGAAIAIRHFRRQPSVAVAAAA